MRRNIPQTFLLLIFGLLSCLFPLAAHSEEIYSKCYRCHKDNGRSWVDEVVTISGQNKEYLINQLNRFKSNERKERLLFVMNDIAAQLSDEEIEALANYYSLQDPESSRPRLPPMTAREIELYKIGEKHSAVCMTCHASAESRPATRPDFPYISGQNQPAIAIQLKAFASGDRENPMMNFIKSEPFNQPEVIEGLALYFSRQKSPRPYKPSL